MHTHTILDQFEIKQKVGCATLKQLAFLEESNPKFPRDKICKLEK